MKIERFTSAVKSTENAKLRNVHVFFFEQRRQYEMRSINATILQRRSVKANEANERVSKSLWAYSVQPNVYRPFIVLVFLFFFQQITGIYAIIFYAVNLCMTIDTNHGSFDEYTAMLFINITRFVFIIINVMYVVHGMDGGKKNIPLNVLSTYSCSKHYGRRSLLQLSGLGMSLAALLAALCLRFDGNKVLILTFVLGYVAFGSLGIITIPWSLAFELLPTEVSASNSTISNQFSVSYWE